MKKIGQLILTIALFLTGCEKPASDTQPLEGKWLWLKSVGGVTGSHTITPADSPPAGGYKMLYILNESEYFLDRAQDNFARLRYTTAPIIDISTGQNAQGIIFYDEHETPGTPQIYEIISTQLIIKDNIVDGYTHYYRRYNE
jgi:hypothetical protein